MSPKIIVEPSANHLGDISNMKLLIDKAKEIGADYFKFQCYTADSITIRSDKKDFILADGPWKGRNLYELYDMAHTPREWFPELIKHCQMVGMEWFASVYCQDDVEFMEDLGCPMYKVASYEIVDIPLIRWIRTTEKPVIMSVGMASDSEIDDAVLAANSGVPISLLHCVSGYPTNVLDSNLRSLLKLRYRWQMLSVGISDHSLGRDVAVAATALGADLIEKHMTLDRDLGGPDAHFSMEPDEFRDLILAVRDIYRSIGGMIVDTTPGCSSGRKHYEYSRQQRRSLYAIKDIAEGEEFTQENIRSIRPGYGLPPNRLQSLLGTKSPKAYQVGDALQP